MQRKPTFFSTVVKFLDGKGFYLVVLFCVAMVGFSGWYLATRLIGTEDEPVDAVTATAPVTDGEAEASGKVAGEGESAAVSGKTQIRVPADTEPSPSPSAGGKDPEPAQSPTPSTEPESEQTQTAEGGMTTPVPLVYTWPVKGDVLTDHSGDRLVYDQTMGDWRVHSGMDIAAVPGTKVLAAAAGTVTAVEQDDLMGTVVTIDHGEGVVSRYANLGAVPDAAVGDKVYTGTVIGAVGETAIAESAMAAHLHFELTEDGAAVDPLDYLPAP